MAEQQKPAGRRRAPTAVPTPFLNHADKPKLRTDLRAPFGDGVYRFALGPREMSELQEKCGTIDRDGVVRPTGIFAIYGRIARGRMIAERGEVDWDNLSLADATSAAAFHSDITNTIRQGLLGGNHGVVDGEEVTLKPGRVSQLIETYVTTRPLEEAWALAFAILGAAISGRKPEPDELED